LDKEEIRDFGLKLGADAVGFAAVDDYKSPRSPDPRSILPSITLILHDMGLEK
jgi:hypothetical protein